MLIKTKMAIVLSLALMGVVFTLQANNIKGNTSKERREALIDYVAAHLPASTPEGKSKWLMLNLACDWNQGYYTVTADRSKGWKHLKSSPRQSEIINFDSFCLKNNTLHKT